MSAVKNKNTLVPSKKEKKSSVSLTSKEIVVPDRWGQYPSRRKDRRKSKRQVQAFMSILSSSLPGQLEPPPSWPSSLSRRAGEIVAAVFPLPSRRAAAYVFC